MVKNGTERDCSFFIFKNKNKKITYELFSSPYYTAIYFI